MAFEHVTNVSGPQGGEGAQGQPGQGWMALPASTGMLAAFVAPSGVVPMHLDLEGNLVARIKDASASTAALRVPDAIQEWWIGPQATWSKLNGWLATAGLGRMGEVVAIDWNPRTGAHAVVVGQAGRDDHNVPSRWIEAGRGSLMAWTNHNGDDLIHFNVSPGAGTADGFIGRAPQTVSLLGAPTSYTQIYVVPSLRTSNTDTFRVLSRFGGDKWGVKSVTVNWVTGVITEVQAIWRLLSSNAQLYMTSAEGGTNSAGNAAVRIAACYNPNAARHEMYLFELDLVTGLMTSPSNGSLAHNAAGGAYLDADTATPFLPDVPADRSRRLFYVRPRSAGAAWAVLQAEWSKATPDAAVYTETVLGGAARTFGVAGRRIGYTEGANYIGGMAYNGAGEIFLSRNTDGLWTIETGAGEVLRRSTTPIVRPMPVDGAPIRTLYSNVQHYGDTYLDYAANLEAA